MQKTAMKISHILRKKGGELNGVSFSTIKIVIILGIPHSGVGAGWINFRTELFG